MENDRDMRNVITILVQAVEKYEIRSSSLNSTLQWIMELPPNNRAALTPNQVEAVAADFRDKAIPFVETSAALTLEKLSGDKPFLNTLRAYASKHFWDRHSL